MSSADTGTGTGAESGDADPVAGAGAGPATATVPSEATPGEGSLRVALDALAAELGDDLLVTERHRDDVWLRVRPSAWKRTAEVARSVGFDYFCFLSGLDWMPATSVMRGEVSSEVTADEADEDPEGAAAAAAATEAMAADEAEEPAAGGPGAWKTGHAGGDTRFQVFARLYSVERHLGITIKADLDDDAPAVETWSEVYPGADWHERETWEMYGFDFVGHPHLRHLYLPGEFEGFPLRKDFPLLAREVKPWPGLVDVEPMPEEPAGPDGEAGDAAVTAAGDGPAAAVAAEGGDA